MANKDKRIEYALHSYDTFWEYYKKTLDERNQIINNYMIFVGIPVSVFGVFIERIKNNINSYFSWIILFLCFIAFLGITMYNSYIVESFVSERYLNQIKHITEYLINNFDNDYKNVFKETYGLQNLFLDKKKSQKHRINKSFIIIICNTMIIIAVFLLIFNNNAKWYHMALAIIISAVIHIATFIYCKKKHGVGQ